MSTGLIGRKLGMTRVFTDDGAAIPVTVIEAGPCRVVQVREDQVQLGFGAKRPTRASKAELGHAARAGIDAAPRVIRTFALGETSPEAGATLTVEIFQAGDLVKVTGRSKGKGFQGMVHRYGRGGGPGSHGNTRHRRTGSIGPGTNPSRVLKGKKMPGHQGDVRHTEMGLRVVRVDTERNLIFVRGAVPGAKNAIVTIAKQNGRSRYA
jgi:large subunit ribosomal protein L3